MHPHTHMGEACARARLRACTHTHRQTNTFIFISILSIFVAMHMNRVERKTGRGRDRENVNLLCEQPQKSNSLSVAGWDMNRVKVHASSSGQSLQKSGIAPILIHHQLCSAIVPMALVLHDLLRLEDRYKQNHSLLYMFMMLLHLVLYLSQAPACLLTRKGRKTPHLTLKCLFL